MNIEGISKLSKERLLDEIKKIIKVETLEKLSKDKISLDLIKTIFPEFKNINIFSKIRPNNKDLFNEKDYIFLLSLILIENSDNVDYFLYKYNISKKDQKRIKIIDNFYKEKINSKTFTENNLNKIFYYFGKQATLDILNYRVIKSKKIDKALIDLKLSYEKKTTPIMPVNADLLMQKYRIPEGKHLGKKLKMIEEEWVKNDFEISDKQVDNIVNN